MDYPWGCKESDMTQPLSLSLSRGFPCSSMVKNPPANAGVMGLILGSGRSPGEGNGNPFRILAWGILWTEEPGRLLCMGSQDSGTT